MNTLSYTMINAIEVLGYSISNDGVVYGPSGEQKLFVGNRGYLKFTIGNTRNKRRPVYAHRMMAYKKFGDKIFAKGIVVRHLDGKKQNNRAENIDIGTQHDNMMDRAAEERLEHAVLASAKRRKFFDSEMEEIRKEYAAGSKYSEIMKKWGISSRGSLHYILNAKYKTSVKIKD